MCSSMTFIFIFDETYNIFMTYKVFIDLFIYFYMNESVEEALIFKYSSICFVLLNLNIKHNTIIFL